MRAPLAVALAALLAACSPEAPPPPTQQPLTGGANQALVASQAHLAGEAPRYGAVAWARQPDADGAAVFTLAPGGDMPVVTATVRDGRIAQFAQRGALTRRSLAALAAAAGAPPGQHGPTAEKVEALIAQAKAKGQAASAQIGAATYAAEPAGDAVTAKPAG